MPQPNQTEVIWRETHQLYITLSYILTTHESKRLASVIGDGDRGQIRNVWAHYFIRTWPSKSIQGLILPKNRHIERKEKNYRHQKGILTDFPNYKHD